MTLVLCLPDGTVLGALPPFEVEVPWWPEAAPVVEAAREAHGVETVILRLLHADGGRVPAGGAVTYLAQVDALPAMTLAGWAGKLDADEPLRLPWARPGGPDADLDWADSVLDARGTPRAGPARQIRTWNLSSLWRLPLESRAAWLKVVPPFFAHEGAMLGRLDSADVPSLIAADGARVLLEEVPGADQHGAVGEPLLGMVRILVSLQQRWIGRVHDLLELGLPDWRPEPLQELAAEVVRRTAAELDPETVATLQRLVEGLGRRYAQIAACGIPPTLVHGDFHRGNVRGEGDRLVLLDWGDCGVGHPLLDQAAFLDRMPAEQAGNVRAKWSRLWRDAIPGSDPDRAATLLRPVGALRQAIVYRSFLDGIEPSERIYHAADPADWLTRAAGFHASA
ncbi:MAG: aminoglycoside phosphotransferase family protein [Gaiellaceae bacterium]